MIDYRFSQFDSDFEAIRSLQQLNLKVSLSEREIIEQGFVTAIYTVENLLLMCGDLKHSMAYSGGDLAGYVLAMLPARLAGHPFLENLLQRAEETAAKELHFKVSTSLIVGQVCVAAGYRRMGVLQELYARMASQVRGRYKHLVTLVDRANQPSIKAHKAFGFREIQEHKEPLGREWVIVVFEL